MAGRKKEEIWATTPTFGKNWGLILETNNGENTRELAQTGREKKKEKRKNTRTPLSKKPSERTPKPKKKNKSDFFCEKQNLQPCAYYDTFDRELPRPHFSDMHSFPPNFCVDAKTVPLGDSLGLRGNVYTCEGKKLEMVQALFMQCCFCLCTCQVNTYERQTNLVRVLQFFFWVAMELPISSRIPPVICINVFHLLFATQRHS